MKVKLTMKLKVGPQEFVGPGEVELSEELLKGLPVDCYEAPKTAPVVTPAVAPPAKGKKVEP